MRLDPPPSKNKRAYAAWGAKHTYCQGCGISKAKAAYPGLSTHHIIKSHRALEGCVQIRLCHHCHQAAEGLTVVVPEELIQGFAEIKETRIVWPRLTIGACMAIKLAREPEEVNWERCEQLRGSLLPSLEPIPRLIEDSYRFHRPWDKKRFYGGFR